MSLPTTDIRARGGVRPVSLWCEDCIRLRWAAMMLVWVFSLQLTIGSLAYTIIGETSSTRLRNKTIGLGRVAYSICGIGFGIMTPYMIASRHLPLGGNVCSQMSIEPDGMELEGQNGLFCKPDSCPRLMPS